MTFNDLPPRQERIHDFHRPTYHFVPPANWMNDPNGVIQWGDQTHLFYQHNPISAEFGVIHWGHAVSDDLIHWRDLPLALSPTPGGADERGCWSGCSIDNGGVPTLMYTGARGQRYETQTQCLATSRDGLVTWEKYGGNPVLSEVPPETGQTHDFRDPYVWREGNDWMLVLATRIMGVGGAALLYRSPDLIHWEYLRPLLVGDIAVTGSVWECPSFFPLGDRWVLIVAGKGGGIRPNVFYFVGQYENHRFVPESSGMFDPGCFYAPYSMRDRQGRRLLWAWLTENRKVEASVAAGWAGAHAIPRVLTLDGGQLRIEPIPELDALRGARSDWSDVTLSGDEHALDVRGLALDIVAEFEPTGTVGLALACAPDGSEQTRILYDPDAQKLSVDRSRSSLAPGNETDTVEIAHALRPGERLRLRILLDGSTLEVIANERTNLCTRIYPSRADSDGLRLFGQGRLNALSVWQMESTWRA